MRFTILTLLVAVIHSATIDQPVIHLTDADRQALGLPGDVSPPRRLVPADELGEAIARMPRALPTSVRFRQDAPAYGVIAYRVAAGTQAAALGMRPGDIVTAITGTRPDAQPTIVSDNQQFLRIRDTTLPWTLTCWSPDRGVYNVAVRPGIIGIGLQGTPMFGAICARLCGTPIPAAYAEHLDTVCTAMDAERFAIAETALGEASNAGCPPVLIDHGMSIIAWYQGRPEVAWNHGLRTLYASDGMPVGRLIDALYDAALLKGDRRRASYIASRWSSFIFRRPERIQDAPQAALVPPHVVAWAPVTINVPASVEASANHFHDLPIALHQIAAGWKLAASADLLANEGPSAQYPPSLNLDLDSAQGDTVIRVTAYADGRCEITDSRAVKNPFLVYERHHGHPDLALTYEQGVLSVSIGGELVLQGFDLPLVPLSARVRIVSARAVGLQVVALADTLTAMRASITPLAP